VVAVEPFGAIDQKTPHPLRAHVAECDRRAPVGVRSTLRWRVVVGVAVAHPTIQEQFRPLSTSEKYPVEWNRQMCALLSPRTEKPTPIPPLPVWKLRRLNGRRASFGRIAKCYKKQVCRDRSALRVSATAPRFGI
jgi:hypothetical protein